MALSVDDMQLPMLSTGKEYLTAIHCLAGRVSVISALGRSRDSSALRLQMLLGDRNCWPRPCRHWLMRLPLSLGGRIALYGFLSATAARAHSAAITNEMVEHGLCTRVPYCRHMFATQKTLPALLPETLQSGRSHTPIMSLSAPHTGL